MKNEDTSFPQYRKLVNGRAFYKITDNRNFEEIQLIGSKKHFYKVQAIQYPEMLKIQDMLKCQDDLYLIVSEKEWMENKI